MWRIFPKPLRPGTRHPFVTETSFLVHKNMLKLRNSLFISTFPCHQNKRPTLGRRHWNIQCGTLLLSDEFYDNILFLTCRSFFFKPGISSILGYLQSWHILNHQLSSILGYPQFWDILNLGYPQSLVILSPWKFEDLMIFGA